MLRYLGNLANPMRKPGGHWPHVFLALIMVFVFAFGAGSGWYARGHLDREQRYAQRYGQDLAVSGAFFARMKPNYRVQMPKVRVTSSSGRIRTAIFPGIQDQDGQGECAAYSAAEALDFEWRLAHPGSMIRFSPRWLYDWYQRGAGDQGSDVEGDLSVVPTIGVPRWKQFPEPPYVIDWPVPMTDAYGGNLTADAAKYIMPLRFTNGSLGATALDFIRAEITLGHPVPVAFAVYSSYMYSTGYVPAPAAGETFYGGHENVILAYDDNRRNPDGTRGAVLLQNQWGKGWGNKGRAWMSFAAFTGPNAIIYEVKGLRLG
jgi:hypothetical protein